MNTKRQSIYDNFRISQESVSDAWTMPYAHCHPAYEIYILTSGARTVTIDDMDYITSEGDATLFGAYMPHKSKGDTSFSGICIHFSERYLDIYFTQEAKKRLMRCFRHRVIALCAEDLSALQDAADDFCDTSESNFLVLASILDILNRNSESGNKSEAVMRKTALKKRDKIIEYTNENYIRIKKISDITSMFEVSENYVFRIFRQKYDMTPKQYINRLKINTVCHRLKYSSKSIKAVAYDCGFDSYEHFINVFKAIIGTTPGEYKKRVRQGLPPEL